MPAASGMASSTASGGAEPEADGGEGGDVGGHRVGVGLATDVEQPLEDVADLGLLEHPRAAAGSELAADPQAGAVEGPDVGSRRREDPRAPLLHLVRRPGVVGQRAHRPRLGAPAGHQVAQPLGQHPGLPRPGRGDHPGGARPVADRGQLVRRQLGFGFAVGRRIEPAGLRAPPVDDADPGGEGRRVRRATVDEQRGAVGQGDVGRTADGPAAGSRRAGRLPAVPPDRLAGPGVVVVGPDQEVEPLHLELEPGGEVVDRPVETLGHLQGVRVHPELDHHRPAFEPRLVEHVEHRAGPGQLGLPDGHPRARRQGSGGSAPRATTTPRPSSGGAGIDTRST